MCFFFFYSVELFFSRGWIEAGVGHRHAHLPHLGSSGVLLRRFPGGDVFDGIHRSGRLEDNDGTGTVQLAGKVSSGRLVVCLSSLFFCVCAFLVVRSFYFQPDLSFVRQRAGSRKLESRQRGR